MSILFECGDVIVWDVASRVGEFYVSVARALGEKLEISTGLRLPGDDSCQVDADEFAMFAAAVAEHYLTSHHRVNRSLIHGMVLTTLVIAERAGRPVESGRDGAADLLAELEVHRKWMGA